MDLRNKGDTSDTFIVALWIIGGLVVIMLITALVLFSQGKIDLGLESLRGAQHGVGVGAE